MGQHDGANDGGRVGVERVNQGEESVNKRQRRRGGGTQTWREGE